MIEQERKREREKERDSIERGRGLREREKLILSTMKRFAHTHYTVTHCGNKALVYLHCSLP